MRANRDLVLGWMLAHEGGYVDHPADPGGATNYGVTQRTYDGWRRRQRMEMRPVRQITMDEVRAIYAEGYFALVRFDEMPSGVDYAVVDYAVNSGPGRAIRDLQRVLGVTADGVFGPVTMAAVHDAAPVTVIRDLCLTRMAFLRRLRHWPTFGRGWTRRVMGDADGVQDGDIGVIDRATMLAIGAARVEPPTTAAPGKAPGMDPAPWWRGLINAILDLFRRPA